MSRILELLTALCGNRLVVLVCPDCRREMDGHPEYPLCPACAVPMREEVRDKAA